MNRTLTFSLVLLALAAFVGYLTLFTVSQTEQALVLEFGKPKRIITEPGLQYKIPFIQNVEFFDRQPRGDRLRQEAARGRRLRPL